MQTLWEGLVRSRAFWLAYILPGTDTRDCATLWADARESWTEPVCGARVTFHVPDGFLLTFEISEFEHALRLYGPGIEESVTVGTMDCHQMSDLFRWDEFRTVSKALSSRVKPEWAVELLLIYYVAVTADCAADHSALLRQCLTASEVFTAAEIDHIVRYSERVGLRRDFRWIADPERGWVAEGQDSYCMRQRHGAFDFATFRAFLTAVGSM